MAHALPLAIAFLDRLAEVAGSSPVTYGVVAGVCALDAFFPLVPSETLLITAAALAAQGELSVVVVALAGAVGALVGDTVSYGLGATAGERAAERLVKRERLARARRLLERHGPTAIVAARFVPGGRTATTFSAGVLAYPWRRFLAFEVVAVCVWATYGVLIGYLGGRAFAESVWKSLLTALGAAAAIALLIEGYRRVQQRRGRDLLGRRAPS